MKLTQITKELSDRLRLAKAVSDFTGGTFGVDSINITAGGSGYSSSFSVSFSGGGGSGAAGTAIAVGGVIQRVDMTAAGSGYTSAPTPSFVAGGGSGGAGTSIMQAHRLDAIATVALTVGLIVFFAKGQGLLFYQLTAGTDAENSPFVVRPDDYNGTTNQKVWKLLQFQAQQFLLYNPDQNKFHPITVGGSSGAEFIQIGVGVAP